MSLPFEFLIGLRYTRSGRRTGRKDRFVSFISATSVVSIALGVMALIIVLSVMNGFQEEVRNRILGMAAHVQITGATGTLEDWQPVARIAAGTQHVQAVAPYVHGQGLLPGDKRESMGESSCSSISIDPLTFNLIIVAVIALGGYCISSV